MPLTNDPEVAAYLKRLENTHERQRMQITALVDRYKKLASERESDKIELQRLRADLKKAAARIRYIEDIPGKRVPYWMQFSIPIPGPTTPTQSVAGQRLSTIQQVSQDGPFVATTYLAAFQMKTYSIGPYGEETGRPDDPAAGTEVITPLSGRWRPVASTADPFAGAYVGARVGPIDLQGALVPQTFRPGIVDFLFEISDQSVDRARQNAPIPSRYLFSEFDRPVYLPVSDFFERGSTIQFSATLTRELGFAEVNYAGLPNGFAEGNQVPPPDPEAPDEVGRVPVAIGGVLYFTLLGYKILQAESPAV